MNKCTKHESGDCTNTRKGRTKRPQILILPNRQSIKNPSESLFNKKERTLPIPRTIKCSIASKSQALYALSENVAPVELSREVFHNSGEIKLEPRACSAKMIGPDVHVKATPKSAKLKDNLSRRARWFRGRPGTPDKLGCPEDDASTGSQQSAIVHASRAKESLKPEKGL